MIRRVLAIALGVVTQFGVSAEFYSADDVRKPDVKPRESVAQRIEGEWAITRKGPDGQYKTVKQHRDGVTVLTTYNPKNKIVHSHRSEYRVDEADGVNIFRYMNKVVLAGPNAGAKDEREDAYIFRLDGEKFYEVHGMLPGDTGKPSLVVWKRVEKKLPVKPKE